MAPRLRDDLVAATIEEEGISCVEVTDPLTSISFRFYDFEYALAQQLTGQPLEAVVAWASATYGIDLGPEALEGFIDKLRGLGFLASGVAGGLSSSSASVTSAVSATSAPADAHPFADIAAMVAGAEAAVSDVPGVEAFAAEIAASILEDEATVFPVAGGANAAAAEYRSKETPSGSKEARPPAPAESDRLPPGLAVLGAPLPPPPATVTAPSPAETPLGSIAHAMAGHAGSAAPVGALDAGAGLTPGNRVVPSHPSFPVTTGLSGLTPLSAPPHSSPVVSPPASSLSPRSAPSSSSPPSSKGPGPASVSTPTGGDLQSPSSWVAELVDQVDHPPSPPVERRAPTRPELVVMPPTPAPVGGEPSVAVPLPRRRSAAALVLLLLAGAAAAAVWVLRPTAEPSAPVVAPSAPVVHVVTPQPTTFYRWYEALGTVSPGRDETLSFGKAGRLQDAMPPGTTFTAGETIARLKGVSDRELLVNRIRSRVAFLEQLRDSSRAQGEAAVRQAEVKLGAKRKELADAQKWQAEMEIRAQVAGEIAQLMVNKGAFVPAGAAVFHVRATGPRASFPLTPEDAAHARALGFCRVETVPGSVGPADGAAPETAARPIDCAPTAPVPGDARLIVDLTNAGGVAPGTQVRLASARYDGVFPVPRSAVVREGSTDRVWVATSGGRLANSHTVEVGATVDQLALVARGLSVGDAIIVDPPPSLKDGAEINVAR